MFINNENQRDWKEQINVYEHSEIMKNQREIEIDI